MSVCGLIPVGDRLRRLILQPAFLDWVSRVWWKAEISSRVIHREAQRCPACAARMQLLWHMQVMNRGLSRSQSSRSWRSYLTKVTHNAGHALNRDGILSTQGRLNEVDQRLAHTDVFCETHSDVYEHQIYRSNSASSTLLFLVGFCLFIISNLKHAMGQWLHAELLMSLALVIHIPF